MIAAVILLAALLGGLGGLLLFSLCNIAHEEDRNARHTEKRVDPFSDVTITQGEPDDNSAKDKR